MELPRSVGRAHHATTETWSGNYTYIGGWVTTSNTCYVPQICTPGEVILGNTFTRTIVRNETCTLTRAQGGGSVNVNELRTLRTRQVCNSSGTTWLTYEDFVAATYTIKGGTYTNPLCEHPNYWW